MTKKRIIATLLTVALTVGSSVGTMAAITDMAGAGTGQEITGTSTVKTPTIKITVPTTAAIVINPFQLKHTIDDVEYTDQIISVPQDIDNESDVAVKINIEGFLAKPTNDGITIMSATAAKATAKSAYLALAVADKDGDNKLPASLTDIQAAAKAKKAALVVAQKDDGKNKGGALVGAWELAAPAEGEKESASFKIVGDVNANPTKVNSDKTVSADPWLSTDTIPVSFKFTFTPQIVTAD